jgi:hypothetical protein
VGATEPEIEAAVHTIVAMLAHPVMRRAASVGASGLRRETPILLRRQDGTLLEGVGGGTPDHFKTPVTRIENVDAPFSTDKDTHFCPSAGGVEEWNSPGYDPLTNLIYTGDVDWCTIVKMRTREDVVAYAPGQFWTGERTLNPADVFGEFARADGLPTRTLADGSGGSSPITRSWAP